MHLKSERTYTSAQVSEIVSARINKIKREPTGLAIVVAELLDRVRDLEDRVAELESEV